MVKYYSTQRPITPGSIPTPWYNRIVKVVNFECKQWVRSNMKAWGYVIYEHELSYADEKGYELVKA